MRAVLLALALALPAGAAPAGPTGTRSSVSVAAAANFIYALDALNTQFRRLHPGVTITTTTGSSGSLFAQVQNGAPFDVFLSADTDYPEALVAAGLGVRSTLRVFATGRLVAWTTRRDIDLSDLAAAIRSVRSVALAQPRTAPYGRAAEMALQHLGLEPTAHPKRVFGESIAQAAQFVETGNADLGLIALSLVRSPRMTGKGHGREIPPEWYKSVSLDHAGVVTKHGAGSEAAREYLAFLMGESARKILREFGYAVPH